MNFVGLVWTVWLAEIESPSCLFVALVSLLLHGKQLSAAIEDTPHTVA